MNTALDLRGTGVAIITPFTSDNKVDFPAYGKIIEHLITNKVEYIVVLGTTGETPVLTNPEKIEILDFTYTTVNKVINYCFHHRDVRPDIKHFRVHSTFLVEGRCLCWRVIGIVR